MTRAGLTRKRRKKLTLSLLPEDLEAVEIEAEYIRATRPRWRQGYRVSATECARLVLLEALEQRAAARADGRLVKPAAELPPKLMRVLLGEPTHTKPMRRTRR